jgi:hypothetical protein
MIFVIRSSAHSRTKNMIVCELKNDLIYHSFPESSIHDLHCHNLEVIMRRNDKGDWREWIRNVLRLHRDSASAIAGSNRTVSIDGITDRSRSSGNTSMRPESTLLRQFRREITRFMQIRLLECAIVLSDLA